MMLARHQSGGWSLPKKGSPQPALTRNPLGPNPPCESRALLCRGPRSRALIGPPEETKGLSGLEGSIKSPPIMEDDNHNPYLLMRKAKIARNEARLKSLGLHSTKEQTVTPRPAPAARTKPAAHDGPVRRSSRLSSKTAPDYKDVPVPVDERRLHSRKRLHDEAGLLEEPLPKKRSAAKPLPRTSAPAANSVRSISLDVAHLVIDSEKGVLGRMQEHTGKEFIINTAFDRSASEDDKARLNGRKLSFNKYCGVQEWANCIFLWVNLGNADSPNEFLDGGRQITWFGGSRMHDESPVVEKLIRYGKDAASRDKIILWCRMYQTETKKFSPYACLGRLGYQSHVPRSQPLSFVWNLLDHDQLTNHSKKDVYNLFQSFVG